MPVNTLTSPVDMQQTNPARERWLTDSPVEFDNVSVVDPKSIGLRAVKGEVTTVPAIFDMPGANGGMDKFAVVRHETAKGEVSLVLRGLKGAGEKLRVKRGGFKIEVPEEGTKLVEVGNAQGNVSKGAIFGRRRFAGKKGAATNQFSSELGDEALELTVTAEGTIFAAATKEQKIARAKGHTLQRPRTVTGRAVIDRETNPSHIAYMTREQKIAEGKRIWADKLAADKAQENKRAQAQENKRLAKIERQKRIFAPRNVPDVTSGDRVLDDYDGLKVTAASREYSRDWVRQALLSSDNGPLEAILQENGVTTLSNQPETIDTIIDSIRTNPAIRLALGTYYEDRIERVVHLMGDNIRWFNGKTPSSVGYEDLRLRGVEYAAMMALSHLDGTFDPTKEARLVADDEVNEFGWPLIDQSRAAARFAIDGITPKQRLRRKQGEEAFTLLAQQQTPQAQIDEHGDDHTPAYH